jgi:hypothetical protein
MKQEVIIVLKSRLNFNLCFDFFFLQINFTLEANIDSSAEAHKELDVAP